MPEPIVTLNEESLKSDLRELVRKTVEDTLNGLLDEEAGDLVSFTISSVSISVARDLLGK